MDERVTAVRNDPMVGAGSCSAIDECYTDAELLELLDREGATTPAAAVALCRKLEGIRQEREDDVRGYGNVSPLHAPREPGRVYDDDPLEGFDLGPATDAELRREGLHRCPDGIIRPTHPSFDCGACEAAEPAGE